MTTRRDHAHGGRPSHRARCGQQGTAPGATMARMAAVKSEPARILIVGGGYVGMYTALGLQKKLKSREASVTVVDPQPHMTYQPFLPEAAAGSIEPRHVVVPLRRVLRKCQVLTGRVTSINNAEREVTVELADGHVTALGFDVLVVAPRSE